MMTRSLYGALVLLIFAAPLAATLCGGCMPGNCPWSRAPEQSAPSEPSQESACHQAEASKNEAPGSPTSLVSAVSWDCCSVEAAPEPEVAATPAGAVSYELALERSADSETSLADLGRSAGPTPRPPSRVSRSLFTLHAAFLI